MRKYLNISNKERKEILEQHAAFYNGFVTKSVPSAPKPLKVEDLASDKDGITLNNKNEVGKYRNHNVNESTLNKKRKKRAALKEQEEVTGNFAEEIKSLSDDELISMNPYWKLEVDGEGNKIIGSSNDIPEEGFDRMSAFLEKLMDGNNREVFEGEIASRGIKFKTDIEKPEGDLKYSDDAYDEDIDSMSRLFDRDEEEQDIEDIMAVGREYETMDDEDDLSPEDEPMSTEKTFRDMADKEVDVDIEDEELSEEEQCEGCQNDDEIYEEIKKEKQIMIDIFNRMKKF